MSSFASYFGGFPDQFQGTRRRATGQPGGMLNGMRQGANAAPNLSLVPDQPYSGPTTLAMPPAAPQRDAGGLNPVQRQNFLDSVRINNGTQATQAASFASGRAAGIDDASARRAAYIASMGFKADALTAPLGVTPTSRTLALNADYRQNALAGANANVLNADAGLTNAARARYTQLTPPTIAGANADAQLQQGLVDPRLAMAKYQAQAAGAQAAAVPAQAAAGVNLTNAQAQGAAANVGGMKMLQQQHQQALRRIAQLEARIQRYEQMSASGMLDGGDGDDGGDAKQQVYRPNAPPGPGPAAAPVPAASTAPQGGQQAKMMVGQIGQSKSTGKKYRWNGSGWDPV